MPSGKTQILTNASIRGECHVRDGGSIVVDSGGTLQLAAGSTANIDVTFDQDVAMTAAGEGHSLTATINHATASVEGTDISVAQLTTARTSGSVSALKLSATSLAGDSGGTYNDLEFAVTDGGGSAVHNAMLMGAGFDALLNLAACATGEADIVLGDNLASAAMFREAANEYLSFVTTNSSEAVKVSQDLDLDASLDMDGVTATIDLSGAISIDAVGNSNVTIDAGNLVLETTTSGAVDINAAGNFTMDAGGTLSMAGVGNSDVTVDAGNLTLQTTSSGGITLTAASGIIDVNDLIKLSASAGADSATGLLIGVGTSGDPATTSTAGKSMVEIRSQSTATSGDFRGIYLRTDFAGAGGAGESFRGNTVINADVAGTVNGGHFSAEVKTGGGNVSGAAQGVRAGFIVPNDGSITKGTIAGCMSEIYLSGTSSEIDATQHSLHRFVVAGADASTRNTEVLNLFSVEGVTSTSGGMYYANTAAVPGNANASLRIITPDGIKYVLLFDAEA